MNPEMFDLNSIFESIFASAVLIIGPRSSGKTNLIKNIVQISNHNKDDIISYSRDNSLDFLSNNIIRVFDQNVFTGLITNQSNTLNYDSTNFRNKIVIFDDVILSILGTKECIKSIITKGKYLGIRIIVSVQSPYFIDSDIEFSFIFTTNPKSCSYSYNEYTKYFKFVNSEQYIDIYKHLPRYHFIVANTILKKIYLFSSNIQKSNITFNLGKNDVQLILATKLVKPFSKRIIIEV